MTRRLASLLGCLVVLAGAAAGEDVPYSRDGADTCLGCHDDPQTLALFAGPHAVPTDPRGPFGQGQLQCEACHGPGGNHAARVRRGEERPPVVRFGSGGLTEVSVQNAMCSGCHAPDLGFGWHGGPHDLNDVACADSSAGPGVIDVAQPLTSVGPLSSPVTTAPPSVNCGGSFTGVTVMTDRNLNATGVPLTAIQSTAATDIPANG